jgi:hypothetical protein
VRKVTLSETLTPLWTFTRGLFAVTTTLLAWLCLSGEVLAAQALLTPVAPEGTFHCGQLAFSLLLFSSILWLAALLVFSHDAFRLWRGELPRLLKWLRTLPALAAALLPPAFVLFRWVSEVR